jgi:hypothetical protein
MGASNADELKMVVQMYSLKYLARLFFRVTKKAERLAVFTPVEGETDDMLAARIKELIVELRAFFYVEEADAADDRIKEMATSIATGMMQEMAHAGAAARATAMASAAAAAAYPPAGVATAGQPGEEAGAAGAARGPVPFSGQGRRLD